MSTAPNPHTMSILIRKLESIATLSDAERQAIQNLPVRIHNLSARQDIVRDGDQPTHCCLILEGWACGTSSSNQASARSYRSIFPATSRICRACTSTRWITASPP